MAWYSRLSRSTRLVAVGGLALGIGFGAMAVATAANSPGSSATPSSQAASGGEGPGGHPRHAHMFRLGGAGTITAVDGGTLTLRTEEGTLTVTTSSSTQYTKLRQTIQLSDLHVGDVVRVRAAAGSTPPPTPGTGTVAASAIAVVEPSLGGRVTGINGDTVDLVGRYGQLLSITLTPGTRYYNGKQTADRSAVAVSSHIVAHGNRDTLTHLTADLVTVLPAPANGRARLQGAAIGGPLPPEDDAAPGPEGLPEPADGFVGI